MHVHKLESILAPRRIALVGISINPNSVSRKVLSNLVNGGFDGVVYPINAKHEAVSGIRCYPDVGDLPETPDMAIICSPASEVLDWVVKCGQAGIRGAIIMSAGFRETGREGLAVEERILTEAAQFSDMRILGPNCLGVVVPSLRLNASFAPSMPKPGSVAFISQSGALCTAVLDWALEEGIGFSSFVSVGNCMDVDIADLIDYFGEDEKTSSIILYLESISHADRFMAAARTYARDKPIIAYKAARFEESIMAAESHTGAMASEDAVYGAAFRRAGITRVYELGDIFSCTELIDRNRIPEGPRLAIVTNAGGPGVMAIDALMERHGVLARLSDDTIAKLNEKLPSPSSHANPVDVLGDATPKRIEKAVKIVIEDPNVDTVLVIITPQAMTKPTLIASRIADLSKSTTKPILATWLGGGSMREGVQILVKSGVPTYRTPEQAVRAFMILVERRRSLSSLYETPKEIPLSLIQSREKTAESILAKAQHNDGRLPEADSKSLLETYGIDAIRTEKATSPGEATAAAEKLGFPVVLKVNSPDISHKTDVGGVALGLQDSVAVKAAFKRIVAEVTRNQPTARLNGVTVQRMEYLLKGVEMIAGIKADSVFGSVIMVGAGGTNAELWSDRVIEFPPINESLARRMLESLRVWPLLNGYRGKRPVDIDKLIETLIRLSHLAADRPEIAELDINPLFVGPDTAVALDARVVVRQPDEEEDRQHHRHLVLRPYPTQYHKSVQLSDGTIIKLRPIKAEDEPRWADMLASCSEETVHFRFGYFIKWSEHQIASRFCDIDYAREMAIVAEVDSGESPGLIGVGRLIAGPDQEEAEYAILVTDAWQERELGQTLTRYCVEIARQLGLKRVVAQTTTDNPRMISVFQKEGFQATYDNRSRTVNFLKELSS